MLEILTKWADNIVKWVGYWNALPPAKKLPAYLVVFNIATFFALIFNYNKLVESMDGRGERCEERYKQLSESYNELNRQYEELNIDYREFLKRDKQFKLDLVDTLKNK